MLSGNPGLGDAEAAALGAALGGRGQAQEQRPEGLGEQGEGSGLPALTHLDLQATKVGKWALMQWGRFEGGKHRGCAIHRTYMTC